MSLNQNQIRNESTRLKGLSKTNYDVDLKLTKPKIFFPVIVKPNPEYSKNSTVFSLPNNNNKKSNLANSSHNDDDNAGGSSQEAFVVALDKPLSKKFITNTIRNEIDYKENLDFLMTQYSANNYYFDNVYDYSNNTSNNTSNIGTNTNNDVYSTSNSLKSSGVITSLYNDYLKRSVFNLFKGESSSFILFGASDPNGKEEVLYNSSKSSNRGLMTQAVSEILNYIEYHNSESNNNQIMRLRITTLMHINETIYDLQNDQITKPINTVVPSNNNNNISTNNTNTSIFSIPITDFSHYLSIINSTKLHKAKITSLIHKQIDHNDTITVLEIDNFDGSVGKLYFIELASTQYGLKSDNEVTDFNRYVFENFNFIGNSLYTVNSGGRLKYEEVGLFGKSVVDAFNNVGLICFCSYLISNLYPNNSNISCLMFVSWLRNQISEYNRSCEGSRNNCNSDGYNYSYDDKINKYNVGVGGKDVSSVDGNNNKAKNNLSINNDNDGNNEYNYNYDYTKPAYNGDNKDNKDHINSNTSLNESIVSETNNNCFKLTNLAKDSGFSTDFCKELKRLQKLKKSKDSLKQKLKEKQHNTDLEKRIEEIIVNKIGDNTNKGNKNAKSKSKRKNNNKSKANDFNSKLQEEECYNNRNNYHEEQEPYNNKNNYNNDCCDGNNDLNFKEQFNIMKFELEHLKQDNISLRNDNIILREDLNRVNEIGANTETELDLSRKRFLGIIQENEDLYKELDQKNLLIQKLNEAISKINFYENPGLAHSMEQKYLQENKIRELEKENRILMEEKNEKEVELKILNDKHSTITKKYEEIKFQLELNTTKNKELMMIMENKNSHFKESNETLMLENTKLKENNEKTKIEIINLSNERNNLLEKYEKTRIKKDKLSKKVGLLETELNQLARMKMEIEKEKIHKEKDSYGKAEMRKQCIENMRNGISNLKKEFMRSRSNNKSVVTNNNDLNYNNDFNCNNKINTRVDSFVDREINEFKLRREVCSNKNKNSISKGKEDGYNNSSSGDHVSSSIKNKINLMTNSNTNTTNMNRNINTDYTSKDYSYLSNCMNSELISKNQFNPKESLKNISKYSKIHNIVSRIGVNSNNSSPNNSLNYNRYKSRSNSNKSTNSTSNNNLNNNNNISRFNTDSNYYSSNIVKNNSLNRPNTAFTNYKSNTDNNLFNSRRDKIRMNRINSQLQEISRSLSNKSNITHNSSYYNKSSRSNRSDSNSMSRKSSPYDKYKNYKHIEYEDYYKPRKSGGDEVHYCYKYSKINNDNEDMQVKEKNMIPDDISSGALFDNLKNSLSSKDNKDNYNYNNSNMKVVKNTKDINNNNNNNFSNTSNKSSIINEINNMKYNYSFSNNQFVVK